MSKTISSPVTVLSAVEARLQAIRSQIATWFWVDGLTKLGWTAIGLIALDLALDWTFRMDLSQRLIMLLLIVGVLARVAYLYLVRPLSAVVSDDALCLQVERVHPQLKQTFISALQFARMDDIEARGMSPAMVRQTVVHGLNSAENVNFSAVMNWNRFKGNSVLLGVAALAVVAFAATGAPAAIWFNRNVLLGDRSWPQSTYLHVERAENGRVVFPRGGDWTQTVLVTDESKVIPESVTLEFRSPRGARAPQPMKKISENRFETTFANVLEEFHFRARGGDAVTPWIRVELVEPPAIENLTLKLTNPKYAGGETIELPPGKGPYFFLKGSSLSLSGTANKGLKSAGLSVDGKKFPLNVSGSTKVAGEVAAADLKAGQFVIDLEDESGLSSTRPTTFGLRLRADREPRVKGKLNGIGGMITAKAKLPLNLKVSDDYGLSAIHAEYHWRNDDPANPNGEGKITFGSLADHQFSKEISFDEAIELPPLNLAPGTVLTLKFVGVDNDDVSGPNIGKSSEFLLRVVSEEELRGDLLRREKEQRQEFERLIKTQEEIITDTRALAAEAGEMSELAPELRATLMQLQRKQKLIAVNSTGIADRLDQIAVESINNRLEEEGGPLEQRLRRDVIQPLRTAADTLVGEVMAQLDQTRRQAGKPELRAAALTAAVESEQRLLDEMRKILSFLIKAEGFQEAINLLLEIQKSEQDVLDRTLKEKQERIKRLLEGKEKPADSPPAEQPESAKPASKPESDAK